MNGHITDIRSIDQNLTWIHIIEPADQINDCRLSRAGRSDNGIGLSRFHLETHIIQNPDAVIFNDSGETINWEYDQIFARANEQIKNVIKAAKARRAARLQIIAAWKIKLGA